MKITLSFFISFFFHAFNALAAWPIDSPLIVNIAPTSPQPYVLPHLQGYAFYFSGQVGRVLVSNETSGGAFSLIVGSSGLATPGAIHTHPHLMEAWLVTKGSVNFWANAQGRLAMQNDFHMFTQGNNHTYGVIGPDSELLIGIQPGGIEKLLVALGKPYTSFTNSPFDPRFSYPVNGTQAFLLGPKYDTIFEPTATVNLDFINGTTPDGLGTWHAADQALPGKPIPYFVSNNNGPKYLERSLYQVIQPLATAAETDSRVTVAMVAMAKSNSDPKSQSFPVHQAFQVTEGQLTLTMSGHKVNLIQGDTAFIPAGTSFAYCSDIAWTKFFAYAPAGTDCLVSSLLASAESWSSPVFPIS